MNVDLASELLRSALLTAVSLAAPLLLIVLVATLVVSLLQALTQVQDQTISVVPRLVVTAGALLALLPWMLDRVIEYTTDLYGQTMIGL